MKSSTRLLELAKGPVDPHLAKLLTEIGSNVSDLERDFEIVRSASRLWEDAAHNWQRRALAAEGAIANALT